MRRIFLALVLLLFVIAPVSGAPTQNVTLNWTMPTTCSDGSAIGSPNCPALTNIKVYCGSATGIYGSPITLGAVTTYTWAVSSTQTIYCAVTAVNAGGESVKSNEAVKTVVISIAPSGPSGCTFAP